jgi:hypothetical protein
LLQTFEEPVFFMKELAQKKNCRFLAPSLLLILLFRTAIIYQNWFSEFLITAVMRLKNSPDYQWRFDARSNTQTRLVIASCRVKSPNIWTRMQAISLLILLFWFKIGISIIIIYMVCILL